MTLNELLQKNVEKTAVATYLKELWNPFCKAYQIAEAESAVRYFEALERDNWKVLWSNGDSKNPHDYDAGHITVTVLPLFYDLIDDKAEVVFWNVTDLQPKYQLALMRKIEHGGFSFISQPKQKTVEYYGRTCQIIHDYAPANDLYLKPEQGRYAADGDSMIVTISRPEFLCNAKWVFSRSQAKEFLKRGGTITRADLDLLPFSLVEPEVTHEPTAEEIENWMLTGKDLQ